MLWAFLLKTIVFNYIFSNEILFFSAFFRSIAAKTKLEFRAMAPPFSQNRNNARPFSSSCFSYTICYLENRHGWEIYIFDPSVARFINVSCFHLWPYVEFMMSVVYANNGLLMSLRVKIFAVSYINGRKLHDNDISCKTYLAICRKIDVTLMKFHYIINSVLVSRNVVYLSQGMYLAIPLSL